VTVKKPALYSLAAAACGLLAAGAALGAAELAAALSKPQTGPLLAVGSAFIDLTPAWLKDFAIRTFGGNDKANDAAVLCGNVSTRNATVYIIDTVLMPKS
jgi:hypothetical protein